MILSVQVHFFSLDLKIILVSSLLKLIYQEPLIVGAEYSLVECTK